MRAREPDTCGYAVRDGVRLYWEVSGSGPQTLLLLPAWAIVDARVWKLQVPYLARHFRVITYDPRGNGRSDGPADPTAHTDAELVADAVAVLDATGTSRAVGVGLSMGGRILLELAIAHPDRIDGAVFVAPSMRVDQVETGRPPPTFEQPLPSYERWGKYNAHYWRHDLPDFARFFFGHCFPEAHSTKAVDDAVEWAHGIAPETMIAIERADGIASMTVSGNVAAGVRCPSLFVHGTEDRIVSADVSVEAARLLGADLDLVEGAGHCPQLRHPVWFNLRLRRFVEAVR